MKNPPPTNRIYGRGRAGSRPPQRKIINKDPWFKRVIAIIAVNTPFILAILNSTPERSDPPKPGQSNTPTAKFEPVVQISNVVQPGPPAPGRLEGVLTDRKGKGLSGMSGMSVGLRNGPETVTDARGVFVLPGAMVSDQLLVVRSPLDRGGEWVQHIRVLADMTTKVNIAYNPASSRLGLLIISAPVDGAILEVKNFGRQYLAEVYGRCDGLDEIFGLQFDAWVLIRSQLDQRLWVQHPSALVDLTSGTWGSIAESVGRNVQFREFWERAGESVTQWRPAATRAGGLKARRRRSPARSQNKKYGEGDVTTTLLAR